MSAWSREGSCALCGTADVEPLHAQDFLLPGERFARYLVVACRGCGFAWARNLPAPEDFTVHYAEDRRYAYEGSGNVAPGLMATHSGCVRMVVEGLGELRPPAGLADVSLLDAGCSTGHLLSLFSRAGCRRPVGLDPSPAAREIARRLYGIEVEVGSLEAYSREQPFDVVVLSSVLEHLVDPTEGAASAARLVRDGGLLFVQVPDAESFGLDLVEPFLEFSIEHVTFFTTASLRRLVVAAGFEAITIRREVLDVGGTSFPALSGLFRRGSGLPVPALEPSPVEPLRSYVARSRARLEEIEAALGPLAESGEPLVVWGAGSLTARLLATTSLRRANVLGFVDSNSALDGKSLMGRPIRPPAWLAGRKETVLVGSFVHGEAIARSLRDELCYEGRVVRL